MKYPFLPNFNTLKINKKFVKYLICLSQKPNFETNYEKTYLKSYLDCNVIVITRCKVENVIFVEKVNLPLI